MELIPLYRSLLAAAGLRTTEDGFVQLQTPDGPIYATKAGKKLVIPTLEQLRSPNSKAQLVFHPLYENTLQNEHEVLAFYRHLLVARLNAVVGSLGLDLLTVAASTATHKDLSPDQAAFLSMVDEPDGRTVDDWGKLARAMPANQVQKAYVSIFLKRSGRIATKSYARVASVNFPLYAELEKWEKEHEDKVADRERGVKKSKGAKGQHQIYDVPLREKDRGTLIGIVKYLIAQVDTPEAYHRGSNSEVAPSLDALMHAFRAIAGRINDIVDLFEGVIPDVSKFRFDSDWVEAFDNLEVLWPQIRNIPLQGSPAAEAPATLPNPQAQLINAMAGAVPAPQQQQAAAPTPTPVQPYQPVPEQPAPSPWAHLQNPPPPPQPQPMQWAPNAPYNPYGMPQQQQHYPQHQQPQHQPQQAQPQSNRGGVSMSALMQANPALAAAAYGVAHQQQSVYPGQPTWPPQPAAHNTWPPFQPPRY